MFLRSSHPESVHVALVSAGTAAIAPKLAAFLLVPLQAAVAAAAVGSRFMATAALFSALCAVPRALSVWSWHRRRGSIRDGAIAGRWETVLLATGLPFALSVGLIAAIAMFHGETSWDTVEAIIAVGYASAMTASVGFRPNVGTAHAVLALGPMAVASLFTMEAAHLTLAVMVVLVILSCEQT